MIGCHSCNMCLYLSFSGFVQGLSTLLSYGSSKDSSIVHLELWTVSGQLKSLCFLSLRIATRNQRVRCCGCPKALLFITLCWTTYNSFGEWTILSRIAWCFSVQKRETFSKIAIDGCDAVMFSSRLSITFVLGSSAPR